MYFALSQSQIIVMTPTAGMVLFAPKRADLARMLSVEVTRDCLSLRRNLVADDKKSNQKAPDAKKLTPDVDTMFAFNQRAFEIWANSMARLSQEMSQFMQTRLQQESEMWQKLAACRNPTDLVQAQSEFASKTGTDYAEVAQKLSRLTMDFASHLGSDALHPPTDTD